MTDSKKDMKKGWRFSPIARKLKNLVAVVLVVSVLSSSALTVKQKEAEAVFCTPCIICLIIDPVIAVLLLDLIQEQIGSPLIEGSITRHINSEENWIVEDFFGDYWVKGLAEMTHFLSAFGMYQVQMVGALFDAKNYMETQHLFYKLHAEAHRDYSPSDDFCAIGTASRSLAATDSRMNLNKLAMSELSLGRQLGYTASASEAGVESDKNVRWTKFTTTYCDPKDNAWTGIGTGLDLACDHDIVSGGATGATDLSRVNRDIDYTRLIDEPRTLNANFSDTGTPLPADEEDILAMAANLYGNDIITRKLSRQILANSEAAQRLYLDLRSVVAKRSVAENSFNAIVALKSEGTNGDPAAATQPDVGLYMASVIKDLMPTGTPDSEIYQILGENPSYYAQLEVLSKKMYQNPDFFANLYDKPANVKRKSVAMKAIELMLDRALFESELRQEMLLSVMLSSKLNNRYGELNSAFARDNVGVNKSNEGL